MLAVSSENGSSGLWLRATFSCLMSVVPVSRVVFTIVEDGHRIVPLRRVLPGSSIMASGSGGLSSQFCPSAVPVAASGSVHAGDPSGGPVVPAFGCLQGQRISSGEPVHAGDPSGEADTSSVLFGLGSCFSVGLTVLFGFCRIWRCRQRLFDVVSRSCFLMVTFSPSILWLPVVC